MKTVKSLKDIDLPIIKKGKLNMEEKANGKNTKIITAILIILLLFCYCLVDIVWQEFWKR